MAPCRCSKKRKTSTLAPTSKTASAGSKATPTKNQINATKNAGGAR